MQVTELSFCSDGIDLAHISTSILFFHIVDVQEPSFMFIMFIMSDTNSWIPCNHMIMNG